MRRWIANAGIVGIGGALTWLAITAGFDPLTVVGGSEPATIWGPVIGGTGIAIVAALLLGVAVLAPRWTFAALAVWVVFLAMATHRIVERSDGSVVDRWLGVAVQSMSAHPTAEPPRPRCAVGTWIARCTDEAGRTLVSPSALPMARLLPGQWET